MVYRIKLKPALSLGIIIVAIVSGVFIYRGLRKRIERKIEAFERTILIKDSSRFIDLKNGVFIAEGKLKALYPQTTPELPGKYFEIKLQLEEYKRHTRVHITPDGDGGTKSRTEVYHSWDVIRTNSMVSDSSIFLGRHIKTEEIDFHYYLNYTDTKYDSDKKFRTVYTTYPEETKLGLLYGECKDNELLHLKFKEGKTIQKEREHLERKYKNNPGMTLVLWFFLWSLVVFGIWFYEDIFESW